MNFAEVGAGLKSVREAHRYCTNKEHGGHDIEDCPLLRYFQSVVERALRTSGGEQLARYIEGPAESWESVRADITSMLE